MNDMVMELKAKNTSGIWKIKEDEYERVLISTSGKLAVALDVKDNLMIMTFPVDVLQPHLLPEDGTVSLHQGIPQRWIKVSETRLITVQAHTAKYWASVTPPSMYNMRKTALLALVAIAQAEVLDTLAQATLLLDMRRN